MKSTRKQELHTNALADFLGRAYLDAKPHANVIGYAALGLAIVVLAYILVIRPLWMGPEKDTGTSGAMARAMAINTSEAMKAFLQTNSGAPQAPAARLILANRLLAEAVRSGSATTAAATLAEAKSQFELAARSSPTLEPMANVGLALVAIQEGNLEKGMAALEEIVKTAPSSIAAVKAKENIERLSGYKEIKFSDDPPDAAPSEPGMTRMPGAPPVPAAPTPSAAATPSASSGIPRSLIPGRP